MAARLRYTYGISSHAIAMTTKQRASAASKAPEESFKVNLDKHSVVIVSILLFVCLNPGDFFFFFRLSVSFFPISCSLFIRFLSWRERKHVGVVVIKQVQTWDDLFPSLAPLFSWICFLSRHNALWHPGTPRPALFPSFSHYFSAPSSFLNFSFILSVFPPALTSRSFLPFSYFFWTNQQLAFFSVFWFSLWSFVGFLLNQIPIWRIFSCQFLVTYYVLLLTNVGFFFILIEANVS